MKFAYYGLLQGKFYPSGGRDIHRLSMQQMSKVPALSPETGYICGISRRMHRNASLLSYKISVWPVQALLESNAELTPPFP